MQDILIGDQNVKWGTCELDQSYGQVKSASLKRAPGSREEFTNCAGGLIALLLRDTNHQLSLKVLFDSSIGTPDLGDPIVFPLAGVTGNILEWSVDWEEKGQVQMSIEAGHWDAMGSNPTVANV